MSRTTRIIWITCGSMLVLSLGFWAAADRPDARPGNAKTFSRTADQRESQKSKPAVEKITTAKKLVTANRPQKKTPHMQPKVVIAQLLTRLHGEALNHFYTDPRLGPARLLPVFQKVVKNWNSLEFSPSELGSDEPIPFESVMKRIHSNSTKFYLTSIPKRKLFDPKISGPFPNSKKKWDAKKKVWEAKSVDLVGLIMQKEPVVYESTQLSSANKINGKSISRRPDDFEFSGISVLASGKKLYARSKKGEIRFLGAIRAKQSCIACHTEKKTGDLLGALSYTLREAKYKRAPPRRRRPIVPKP